MIINGLGFGIPFKGVAKAALFPAAIAHKAVAGPSKRIVAGAIMGAVAGALPASPAAIPPPRNCGFGDRIAILFGAKNRGCLLPSGEIAGDQWPITYNATDENAIANYVRMSGGLTGKDNRPGGFDGLGIPPLIVAALAPVAIAASKNIAGRLAPKKAAPPCGFFQRVSKVFGGRPPCS